MNAEKLSINKACVFLGLVLLLSVSAIIIILYKVHWQPYAACFFACLFWSA